MMKLTRKLVCLLLLVTLLLAWLAVDRPAALADTATPTSTETPTATNTPTATETPTATPVQKLPGGPERKFQGPGCVFSIQLMGVSQNNDDTFTWQYEVNVSGGQRCGLSHWVLSLCQPNAFSAYVDSEPDPSDLTLDSQGNPRPDPTTGIVGVKWDDISDNFAEGIFSVTLGENLSVNPDVELAFKVGAGVVFGTIEGPDCPHITVTKTRTSDSTVTLSDPVTFEIVVENVGDTTLSAIQVTDIWEDEFLIPGIPFVANVSGVGGVSCGSVMAATPDPDHDSVVCTLTNLDPTESTSFRLNFRALAVGEEPEPDAENCADVTSTSKASGTSPTDGPDCDFVTIMPLGFMEIEAGTGVETGSIDGPGGDPSDDLENSFKDPAGLDGGSLYVADRGNNRVVLVESGTLVTVAGTGAPGYTGDSGPATSAQLNEPWGIDLGADGSLYIGDTGNHVVRKVIPGADGVVDGDPDDIIVTVAGIGTAGYSGDYGPAILAQLDSPHGVVVSGEGGLYIADTGNDVIRKVHTDDNITTYAGGGQGCVEPCRAIHQRLGEPIGVDIDSSGQLFIGEAGGHRVRRVDSPSIIGFFYKINTVAGTGDAGYSGDGGPAIEAQMDSPRGVAVDLLGRLFVADTGNHVIRRVEGGGVISTMAGGGSGCTPPCEATDQVLFTPQDVAVGSLLATQGDEVDEFFVQSAGSTSGGGQSFSCGAQGGSNLADPYLMATPVVGLLYLQLLRRRRRQ